MNAPSLQTHLVLQSKANVAVMKMFCDYMLKSGRADSKAACKQIAYGVIDKMVADGGATADLYKAVDAYLSSYLVRLEQTEKRAQTDALVAMVGQDIGAAVEGLGMLPEDEVAQLTAFKQAKAAYESARAELLALYKPIVMKQAQALFENYGAALTPEFTSQFMLA